MYNQISHINVNVQTFGRKNGKDNLFASSGVYEGFVYERPGVIETKKIINTIMYNSYDSLKNYNPNEQSIGEHQQFLGEIGFVEFKIVKGILRKTLKVTIFLKREFKNIRVCLDYESESEQERYLTDKEKVLSIPGINDRGRLYQKTDFDVKYI